MSEDISIHKRIFKIGSEVQIKTFEELFEIQSKKRYLYITQSIIAKVADHIGKVCAINKHPELNQIALSVVLDNGESWWIPDTFIVEQNDCELNESFLNEVLAV